MTAPFFRQLSLHAFRNYADARLECDGRPVVLTGPNGAGKTNILEAISLFSPGRGLRHAKMQDLDSFTPQQTSGLAPFWAVHGELVKDGDVMQLGSGKDAESALQGTDKRVVRVEGQVVPQQRLAEYLSVLWLTPQLDSLFQEGMSARRKFFDRLAYGFDAQHARHVTQYETALRERHSLFERRVSDRSWYLAVERKMAEMAVVVAASRLAVAERINAIIASSSLNFPKARLEVSGLVEDALKQGKTAIEAEVLFQDYLMQHRQEEMHTGRTQQGAHKSQWQVWHVEKGVEAGFCSTGEQKAILLSIVLAQTRARKIWGDAPPILLLDEVVAHLDLKRRRELADEILDIGVQAWLTGTDAETFADFHQKAQFFSVLHGKVMLQNR